VATRVDAVPFVARLPVFEYLLDHPEFATHLTRMLRLARYRIWQTPRGLYLDDGWGGTGYFWVVYAGNGTRLMRARGEFKQTLMPTIQGEAVTMIEYEATPAPDGKSRIRSTVSGYVKLDSRFMAIAMKMASGAAQRKADLEARRLMKTFARASQAIDVNPAGVYAPLRLRPGDPGRAARRRGPHGHGPTPASTRAPRDTPARPRRDDPVRSGARPGRNARERNWASAVSPPGTRPPLRRVAPASRARRRGHDGATDDRGDGPAPVGRRLPPRHGDPGGRGSGRDSHARECRQVA